MWVKRCFLKAYLTISQPAVKGTATVRNIGALLQREKRNKPLLSAWSKSAHVGNPLSPTLHFGSTPCTMWLSPAARWWHCCDLVLVSCCGHTCVHCDCCPATPAAPGKACIVPGSTAVPLALLPSFTSAPSCSRLGGR